MALVSPFTLAPVTVTVYGNSDLSTPLFSSDIGLSSSNTFNDWDEPTLTLTVDSAGVINLSRSANVIAGDGYLVNLAMPVGAKDVQITSATVPSTATDFSVAAYADSALYTQLSYASPYWVPNPCDFIPPPSSTWGLFSQLIDASSFHTMQIMSFLPLVDMTPPVPIGKCRELGRATRTYVSGYTLSRQAVTRVRRSAKRCVVANFNGAIPKGNVIASVRWETTSPWAILMSNARIATGQRETMVDVFFNFAGWGGLQATVTLDNGDIYNAEFSFTVIDSPLYPSADYPPSNGPYRLDATA